MALTREDLESLLRWLDEDPEFRAALRRRLLAEPLIIEVRLPTDWMAKVDSRLDGLEKDMGILKGKVLKVEYRTKAASIFGMILRGGREASEFVSGKLEEAEIQGTVSPQEADFVMAADLLWMGNIRRGKFEGETLVLVGESSWKIEAEDVERAVEKAKILRKVGIWAIPFVGGAEWASPELKEQALKQKVLCATDAKLEPSRSDPDEWERFLESWRP
mgnify:CR=1 FL=1|jgi:hypothetical protein